MDDDLLSYYNQELAYLTRLGAEFAEQHPAAAGRLRISADSAEDPHVSRLLQGVAFLNARIHRRLDDEFPELTNALLAQLYPHYLAPIPSMAICAFHAERDLPEARLLPAGSEIETEPTDGETCRFRTTQETQLWPLEIDNASLSGRPFISPANPPGSVSLLRLTIRCMAPEMTFAQLAPDTLRFFIRGGSSDARRLYELIFNNTVAVAIAESNTDPSPLLLEPTSIRPVGFEVSEGMLPYRSHSPPGYRLLTEFFAFPEKFHFFDVTGLARKTGISGGRKLDIYFYFNRAANKLEGNVSADHFALGCTPMINLFRHRAEAIPLTHTAYEYRVIPDNRRPGTLEIYSVDNVMVTSRSGEAISYVPFFGLTHSSANGRAARFWHAVRRASGGRNSGSETFVSFVDLEGNPSQPGDAVASLETTCFNCDLPAKLPFGAGRPRLRLMQAVPGVASVACLTAPTPTLRPPSRKESAWRLISHLTLNHLSLVDQQTGPEALREILRLYDFRDAPDTRAMIDSILSVKAAPAVARAPDSIMSAICHGLDVTIELDEQRASGAGVFLLASVLERFIGLYASINAFTRLTATVEGRAGVLRTWTPRAGNLTLL
jgi:type VI secretion system protein ImpG